MNSQIQPAWLYSYLPTRLGRAFYKSARGQLQLALFQHTIFDAEALDRERANSLAVAR